MYSKLKNAPMDKVILSVPHTLIRYVTLARGLKSKKDSAAKMAKSYSKAELMNTLIKAWFHAFLEIPRELKKRQKGQSTRIVPRTEMERWFREYGASVKDVVFKVDKKFK